MALNFTPLSAYKADVESMIEQNRINEADAAKGLGTILGMAKVWSDQKKTRDFFAQFDDSDEIAAIDGQIDDIDEQIASLENELKNLGGSNGID